MSPVIAKKLLDTQVRIRTGGRAWQKLAVLVCEWQLLFPPD